MKPLARTSIVLGIALALASAMLLSGCGKGETATPDKETRSAQASGVLPVKSGSWAELTLTGGGSYYGQVGEGANGFVVVNDPYYPLVDTTGKQKKTMLRQMGTEFHAPNGFMIVPVSTVSAVQAISAKSLVLDVIEKNSKKKKTSAPKWDEVESLDIGAVFLMDGRLLFGKVDFLPDGQMSVEEGFYLTRSPKTGVNAPIESLDDMALVAQLSKDIGREGPLFLSGRDVLFVQSIRSDSPVRKAITGQNP